ncbi:MAG: hypothetical protein CSA24_00905 [Deltaproteobacteria bacterium]|nr:MAG: hypothetical protein CSB49_06175 [Pseudomonadota bacterium]PIE66145.1 MAG: hypothetical protein CSA24_00905 [Deltaproteobacteria bacterium]
MKAPTRSVLVLALLLPWVAGCPKKGASTVRPDEVLKAYAKALKGGDYGKAHRLMSKEMQKRYPRAAFIKLLKASPKEVARLVAQAEDKSAKVEIQAVVALSEGDTLALKVEDGKWRLAADPIDFYSQRTPREALRSFIRAIERRRYEVVLRFVPSKWAAAMTKAKIQAMWEGEKRGEVELLLKELKKNADAPIQVSGNTATMPYGVDKRVSFVREDGLWKVEDPD